MFWSTSFVISNKGHMRTGSSEYLYFTLLSCDCGIWELLRLFFFFSPLVYLLPMFDSNEDCLLHHTPLCQCSLKLWFWETMNAANDRNCEHFWLTVLLRNTSPVQPDTATMPWVLGRTTFFIQPVGVFGKPIWKHLVTLVLQTNIHQP